MSRRRLAPAVLLAPAATLLACVFLLPLAQVVTEAVWDGRGLTLVHFHRLFGEPLYLRILWRTLGVAVTTTAWCLLLGYPAAYYLAALPPAWRQRLMFFVLVPLWMSVLVRSFAWMAVLGRQGPLNAALLSLGIVDEPIQFLFTTGAVTLAMIQVLLPFSILICLNAMLAIDPRLVRAARAHGASPQRAFIHVFLPLSAPGIIAAAVLTSILATGFFITPMLLGGPRNQLIGNLIVGQISETVNWGFAAAIALLLVAATLVLVAVLRLAVGRSVGTPS